MFLGVSIDGPVFRGYLAFRDHSSRTFSSLEPFVVKISTVVPLTHHHVIYICISSLNVHYNGGQHGLGIFQLQKVREMKKSYSNDPYKLNTSLKRVIYNRVDLGP